MHGARGSLRAAAQRRMEEGELSVDQQLDQYQRHFVTELAQARTEDAVNTIAEIMDDADNAASVRLAAAKSLLEWGWVKPGHANGKPGGSEGGRSLEIHIVQIGSGGVEMARQIRGEKVDGDPTALSAIATRALSAGMVGGS